MSYRCHAHPSPSICLPSSALLLLQANTQTHTHTSSHSTTHSVTSSGLFIHKRKRTDSHQDKHVLIAAHICSYTVDLCHTQAYTLSLAHNTRLFICGFPSSTYSEQGLVYSPEGLDLMSSCSLSSSARLHKGSVLFYVSQSVLQWSVAFSCNYMKDIQEGSYSPPCSTGPFMHFSVLCLFMCVFRMLFLSLALVHISVFECEIACGCECM